MEVNRDEVVHELVNKKISEVKKAIGQLSKKKVKNDQEVDALYKLRTQLYELEQISKKFEIEKDHSGNITNLSDLITYLSTEKVHKAEMRRNALCKLAAEKERQRLYQPIQYDDGTWDIPILCAESVRQYEQENNTDEND